MPVTEATPFRTIGDVPFSAWREEASRFRSPITLPELEQCWKITVGYSALALAQAIKETQIGATSGAKCNPLGLMTLDGKTLAQFPSWEAGFSEWLRRVSDITYKGGVYAPEAKSLRDYLVVYVGGPGCLASNGGNCANGETWNPAGGSGSGSINLYISQTVERINKWQGATAVATNPFPTPPIYSLARDYARYNLTKAQADKIRGHKFYNRNGYSPLAVVLHIQEGSTNGSLSWWASGNANASSTVIANRDGSILTVLDDAAKDGPWTNGDTNQPSAKGRELINRIGGVNPNLVSLTIEAEGYSASGVTDVQLQAICWQVAEWFNRFGFTVQNLYRHADINSVTRSNCPGVYYDAVVNALSGTGIAKPQFTGLPPEITAEDVYSWFPEADPTGTVTAKWLARCKATNLYPSRVEVTTAAPDSKPWAKRFRFSDGYIIYANKSGRVWAQGEPIPKEG